MYYDDLLMKEFKIKITYISLWFKWDILKLSFRKHKTIMKDGKSKVELVCKVIMFILQFNRKPPKGFNHKRLPKAYAIYFGLGKT